MKSVLTTLIAASFCATAALASPYCDNLETGEGLSKKHARMAPIYSDVQNGWIFTKDQLKDRYDMKSTSAKLVAEIVAEFDKRGIPLAIMVTPPRPVVAGQSTLDATMGTDYYDVAAAAASFDALIDGLSQAGALAPNLQTVAVNTPGYYFQRDTHWTPAGAMVSAFALADVIQAKMPGIFDVSGSSRDRAQNGFIEEKGSLARIIRKECGLDMENEEAPTFDLTLASMDSLLGDAPVLPKVALLGSSFSNRYQTDFYRTAEALAFALNAEVENMSISGGGAIGAIESFVLSGALDASDHDLVIWELPYTSSFNSVSSLRQLLGALRAGTTSNGSIIPIGATKTDVPISIGANGIKVTPTDNDQQRFVLNVHFDNGSKTRVNFGRRDVIPANVRSKDFIMSFAEFENRRPVRVEIEGLKESQIESISIFN